MLAYFDPEKEVTLQVDASKHGQDATSMQEGRPVAYASKLEKELYAVLYGCKRFHEYLYGRNLTVESDHKLERLERARDYPPQTPSSCSPHLQRMMFARQKYCMTLIHRPGKEISVADTLSRKSLDEEDEFLSEAMKSIQSLAQL